MKAKFVWGALFIGVAVFVIFGRATGLRATQDFTGEPEIFAVTFSAAWCSACKVLKPKVIRVMETFNDQPVHFIELDFTFGEDRKNTVIAADGGFTDVYNRMKGATGFTLLIDRDSGVVIDTLTAGQSAAVMGQSIHQAIAVAKISDGVAL